MMKNRDYSQENSTSRGFSVLDLLIVVVILSIIVTYVLAQIRVIQRPLARTNAAQRFTAYLQNARSDSMRRHATETNRMAQITILDAHGYNVAMDANGDGILDPPSFIDLADQHLQIDGPFPRTFMFDAQGRTVDPNRTPITTASITFSDGSGKNVIKIADVNGPTITKTGS